MKKDKKKSDITRLLELSGRRKGLLIVSAITVTVHSLLSMVPYILIFYILTELLNGRITNPDINTWLIWAFTAVVISAVMLFISGIFSHIAAFNILYELRCKITDKLGRLPMGYLKNRSSGSLKKILVDDVERIENFIAHNLPDTIRALILPLVILGYLFIIDYRLALASLLSLIVLVISISALSGSEAEKTRIKKYHESLEKMNSGIVEFVRAMPVMKIFGQSASAFVKYSGTVKEFDFHLMEWTKLTAPLWGIIMSFLNNALLPLLIFGLYLYFKGDLELPVFFLFLILGVGYMKPAFQLASIIPEITMISHGVTRMDEILFEVEEQKGGSAPVPDEFSLEFKQARFFYIQGIEVIKDVSFKVPQGTITALVGPSGSGKSTAGVDQIVVLDNGQVEAVGTHRELLKKNRLYTRMWNAHQRAKEFEIINK